jgi:hypothetical protein
VTEVKRSRRQAPGLEEQGIRLSITGTFQKKVDQQAQITRDVARASSLASLLLVAYLMFHFRSPVAVALVLAPVGIGLAWTYGATAAVYGSVNLLTGFLGAILGGPGSAGIHLLGRFALRDASHDSSSASREVPHTAAAAVSGTGRRPDLASLAISEFRAFREFGVIAGSGCCSSSWLRAHAAGAARDPSRYGWSPARSRRARQR